MGIDTTGDSTRSFYDGHGHPFSQGVEGWHGRPGSERRAVWVVDATQTNHPNSETGRAGFNVRLEGFGRRHPKVSRGSKSDRTRQHSRSYWGPAAKRWTLREVSMNGGTPLSGLVTPIRDSCEPSKFVAKALSSNCPNRARGTKPDGCASNVKQTIASSLNPRVAVSQFTQTRSRSQ